MFAFPKVEFFLQREFLGSLILRYCICRWCTGSVLHFSQFGSKSSWMLQLRLSKITCYRSYSSPVEIFNGPSYPQTYNLEHFTIEISSRNLCLFCFLVYCTCCPRRLCFLLIVPTDRHQFAFRPNRCTFDAVALLWHCFQKFTQLREVSLL